MAGDERDAIADQLAGERRRLLGVAEIVADDQLALAEHAALGPIIDRRSMVTEANKGL
jgi:hypothetical protein